MKNTLRVLSMLFAVILCLGMLAGCGGTSETKDDPTKAPATDPAPSTDSSESSTEPFVAPPDQVGAVVSADSTLVTWYTYATEDDTVDFMGVDVNALGEKAAEMSLLYLEEEVTYYAIVEGKLVEATIEDVVPDSVIGITTLEEGVQEVYILYAPVEDDGSDEYEDSLEEIVEDTVPDETTSAEEEGTPEEEATVGSDDFEYEGTPEDETTADDGV